MKKLIELEKGDALRLGDVIVEERYVHRHTFTVYKINEKFVTAYGDNMRKRLFPVKYGDIYGARFSKYSAKVFRYQK